MAGAKRLEGANYEDGAASPAFWAQGHDFEFPITADFAMFPPASDMPRGGAMLIWSDVDWKLSSSAEGPGVTIAAGSFTLHAPTTGIYFVKSKAGAATLEVGVAKEVA